MSRILCSPILLILLGIFGATNAGEAPTVSLPVALSGSKPPRAGEWFEYIVAFPLDPLEHAIRQSINSKPSLQGKDGIPSDPPSSPDEAITKEPYVPPPPDPEFDPQLIWMTMPLRLEILQTSDTGCQAMMTYAGLRHEVHIPFSSSDSPKAPVASPVMSPVPAQIDDDVPELETDLEEMFAQETLAAETSAAEIINQGSGKHWLGSQGVDVTVEFNNAEHVGFTRLINKDLPFGLARIATDFVDLILVAQGVGFTPDFPSTDIYIEPPPGQLHRRQSTTTIP